MLTAKAATGRTRGRVFKALVAGFLVASTFTISDAEAGGVTGEFSVIGTVAEADLSPGDVLSHANLNPITEGSASVEQHYNTTDGFDFNTSAMRTTYYKMLPSGQYAKSDFESVVVVGADLKVTGDRITEDDGTVTFLARFVFNPPPPPVSGPSPGPAPSCGPPPTLDRVGTKFLIVATITRLRVHVPCTNIGNSYGGFVLSNPVNTLQPRVAQAFADYNGRLDIYNSPTTEYYLGNTKSTYDKVVRLGRQALVRGNFIQSSNGWVFIATRVVTPYNYIPPQPGGFAVFRTNIQGARQGPDTYGGSTFGGPNYSSPTGVHTETLTFTGGPGTYGVTGTWSINDSVSSLSGTVDTGYYDTDIAGASMGWGMTFTGGTGQFTGCSGTGTFESDSVTPDLSPLAKGPASFTGVVKIFYTC